MEFRSKSGRHHRLKPTRLLIYFVALLLPLFFIGVLSSLWTPLLHVSFGDSTWERDNKQALLTKLGQDHEAALINLFASEEVPDVAEIPTVEIFVDGASYASLNHQILRFHLGELDSKPKVKAWVRVDNGELKRAKVGYRGTNNWHHQYWKPSLQIRYPSYVSVDGFSRHNLIVPEDGVGLRNWLSIELARLWGMISYEEHFARVFVNRRYLGLYNRAWPLGDRLLQKQGRPVGPFFRLELKTGALFDRNQGEFTDPASWEIEGTDRRVGEHQLKQLLDVIDMDEPLERCKALARVLDAESFAKYLAVLNHSASVHVDTHNVALWLNRSSGLFHPVLIDVNGYSWSHTEIAQREFLWSGNDLMKHWMADPRNLALYVDKSWELVTTLGSVEAITKLVSENWAKIRPQAVSDLNTSEMGARNLTMSRTLMPIPELDKGVERLLEYATVRAEWMKARMLEDQLTVVSRSQGAFEVLAFGLSGVLVERKDGKEFPWQGTLAKQAVLLPTISSNGSTYGLYLLPGSPEQYRFVHRLDGHPMEPVVAGLSNLEEFRAAHGIRPEQLQKAPPLRLKGQLEVQKSLSIKRDVIIEPGTTITVAPGACLVIRGDLTARGTVESPIVIKSLDAAIPYGAVAVNGGEVDFSHVQVSGGSGAEFERVYYRGGLSLHNAKARLESVELKDTLISAVDSTVEFFQAEHSGAFPDPILSERAEIKGEVAVRERTTPSHDASLLSGPAVGTPPRKEREFKYTISGTKPDGMSTKDLLEHIRKTLEKGVAKRGWRASLLTKLNYRVDQEVKDYLYRDVYYDSEERLNYDNAVSYRYRNRFRSWKSYRQHLRDPEWARHWPFRLEYQAKTGREELGEGFSTVEESRFEFRFESQPFSLENPPPPPLWNAGEFSTYFEIGRYRGKPTFPAQQITRYYQEKGLGTEHRFRPELLLLTERHRMHLNMKTPYGSGPNPEQVFIMSFDRCKVLPAGLTASEELELAGSAPEFFEVEVEFERNTSELLDKAIEEAKTPEERQRLESARQAFLDDQKRLMQSLSDGLQSVGLTLKPASQSKYLSAYETLNTKKMSAAP